jgi:predicted enzyme related to lactoylglutathione lyase
MIFTEICLMTKNVPDLVRFYETIFNTKAEGDSTHSFISAAGLGIAIYDINAAETVMGFDFTGTGTGMFTIGFNVDDVDAEHTRIKSLDICGITEPQLWPWGAKSFRFTDPDGNIIIFRSWTSRS